MVRKAENERKGKLGLKKVVKITKGDRSNTFQRANEAMLKSLWYATRDRPVRKRDLRRLWIARINAASRMNGVGINRNNLLLSLFTTIVGSFAQLLAKDKQNNLIVKNTIVSILLGERIRVYSKTYLLLLAGLFTHTIFCFVKTTSLNTPTLWILISLIFILFANQKILEYRVKNGFYGSSTYELREIISFILTHSDKDDFIQGGKIKRILEEPIEETKLSGEEVLT